MGVFAGYTRVSRVGDRGETLISPKLQEKAIRGWAQGHGHELVMLPAELDRSGGDDTRPILGAAIERIEEGELDGIAVWKFDRFTRSLKHSLAYLERIEEAGGQLGSASEALDPSTVSGRTTRNILFSIAQGEREQKGEEIERSKADAVSRGVWSSPKVPTGYLKGEDRRLAIDPVVGPLVRGLFERRANGWSWKRLADLIGEKLGRPFYGPTVSRIIRNPVYLGEIRYGPYLNADAHPALVDRALWDAAQLEHPRPARGTHGPALLGGIIRCAGCGWRMTSTVKRGEREYRCRRRGAAGVCPAPAVIVAKLVEPFVESAFLKHAADLPVDAVTQGAALADAEHVLAEAEAELAAYQEAVRVAEVGAEHFAAGMRERVEAVEVARQRVAELRLAAPPIPDIGVLAEVWPELGVEERNHVLRRSLGVVWVRQGRADVDGRVRVIARGFEPAGLSVQGKAAAPRLIDWPASDLPGELRPAAAKDLAEA